MKRRFLKEKNFSRHIILKHILWGLVCMTVILLSGYKILAQTVEWQDFEYWDSPQNHGWVNSNPSYPFWGPGVGYGTLRTIIDYAKGSRVLEVWNQPSVFNRLSRFCIKNSDSSLREITAPIISFDISGIFGLEQFDRFEFQIWLTTRNDDEIVLRYIPIGESYQMNYSPASIIEQEENTPTPLISGGDPEAGIPSDFKYTLIKLGRQYQDGSWHKVIRDMDRDIYLAKDEDKDDPDRDGFGKINKSGITLDEGHSRINMIQILGNRYKVDNIFFHEDVSTFINHPPKLQKIGPIFAQIFKTLVLNIKASDIDYEEVPGYPYGKEPSLHPERHPETPEKPFLYFEAYVGGRGVRGIPTSNLLTRVMIDYETGENIPCSLQDDSEDNNVNPTTIQLIYTPQILEDLIVTVCVYDERGLSDTEVFPLTVVNYPIPNYPPQLEELEDDIYILGDPERTYFKQIVAYDIDDPSPLTFFAFIDDLPYYSYGSYQEDLIKDPLGGEIEFTPVFEGVHRITVLARDTRGLIAVGDFKLVVANPGGWYNHPPILGEDIDSPQYIRAGQSFSIPIEFFDPDLEPIYYSCNIGMISHLPAEGIESHIGKIDPDVWGAYEYSAHGIYRSGAIYSLMTHYPGIYHIEITAHDIRGGIGKAYFILDVQPWWSF